VYDHMCQQQCDQRIGYAAGLRPGNMSQIGARSAYLALRDFDPANVSCGSTTDLTAPKFDFRSSPKSGLKSDIGPCPVRAKSGHRLGAKQKGGRHQIFPIAFVVVMFTIVTYFSAYSSGISWFCAHEESNDQPNMIGSTVW
jgi:hypothetical protein